MRPPSAVSGAPAPAAGAARAVAEARGAPAGPREARPDDPDTAALRSLLAVNPLPTLVLDRADLRVLAANEAALAQHGCAAHELLGRCWADRVVAAPGLLAGPASGSEDADAPALVKRRDGERVPVRVRVRDATWAGRAARLAVTAPAPGPAPERLRELDRLARLGGLAAGLAHRINNPVATILAGSELALACEDEPAWREHWREALHESAAAARQAARVLRGLLELARGGAGEHRVEDLRELVRRARRPGGGAAAAGVVLHLPADPVPARVCALGLEQALEALVRNATESHAAVGVREPVRVALQRGADGSSRVRVRDAGRGIPEEHRAHVFEPFFTAGRPGHLGLGLTVAREIARAHGGDVRAGRAPGGGASLTLELPPAGVPQAAARRYPGGGD